MHPSGSGQMITNSKQSDCLYGFYQVEYEEQCNTVYEQECVTVNEKVCTEEEPLPGYGGHQVCMVTLHCVLNNIV